MNKEEVVLLKEKLARVYKQVEKNYEKDKVLITGSCALVLIVDKYLDDKLNDLDHPNDIDFIVENKYLTIDCKIIDKYKREQELGEKSCTFIHRMDPNEKIDLIATKKIGDFITIDGLNLVTPEKLKICYEPDILNLENRNEKDLNKFNLISNIVESLKPVDEFPKKKRIKLGLFSDDEDDMNL